MTPQRIVSLLAAASAEQIHDAIRSANAAINAPRADITEDAASLTSEIGHLRELLDRLTTELLLPPATQQVAPTPIVRTRNRSVLPVDFRVSGL